MVDVEPLPPPYRGTISAEDEPSYSPPSHSPLTAPVLITPDRTRSNRESQMNRSVQLRHRCDDEINDGGVGGIVSDCDTPAASRPFGSSPFQSRLFAERMRCLTRQVHHFASTQANEFGEDGGNDDAVGRSETFQEEEKKADDEFISVNADASTVDQAWSSLENAVQMVMEHCRLAQEEARDSQQEQVQASVYRERATAAEEQNAQLQEELRALKAVGTVGAEERVEAGGELRGARPQRARVSAFQAHQCQARLPVRPVLDLEDRERRWFLHGNHSYARRPLRGRRRFTRQWTRERWISLRGR
jgi:hypothetical protein